MEIPYTVTARPDTGLWNAKIGIWLFLASEVMLFGGLFSSLVYLRLGADYPWPWHELIIWPGFINTFVLIASSVTVLLAWASLKMRKWKQYQFYMLITILCSFVFLGLKSYEYYGKFTHYSVKLVDGTLIDGHRPHGKNGEHMRFDEVDFNNVKSVTISFDSVDGEHSDVDFLDHLYSPNGSIPEVKFKDPQGQPVTLTNRWIKDKVGEYRKLKNKYAAEALQIERQMESAGRPEFRDLENEVASGRLDKYNERYLELKAKLEPLKKELDAARAKRDSVPASIKLTVDGAPLHFWAPRSEILPRWTKNELTFREGTKLEGELVDDSIVINAWGWDVRQVKGVKDDIKNSEKALAWKYLSSAEKDKMLAQTKESIDKFNKAIAEKGHSHGYTKLMDDGDIIREALTSRRSNPSYQIDETIKIKNEDIRFFSNYGPKLNTYYAIYFLMTGLHGLHVIGGIVVFIYFLLFSKKLYDKNPEHMANRVEVGGLFWHFVDLVWIFLFPIFYLL